MDVLSSRILLRPVDPARSQAFYRDVLGLAVHREFGPPEHPGVVFFLGNGLLELSGSSTEPPRGLALWLQVRDAAAEQGRLAGLGVRVVRPARLEPWGLAANGQAGVENVLDLMRDGLGSALTGLGHRSARDLSPDDLVVPPAFERHLGEAGADAPVGARSSGKSGNA